VRLILGIRHVKINRKRYQNSKNDNSDKLNIEHNIQDGDDNMLQNPQKVISKIEAESKVEVRLPIEANMSSKTITSAVD